MRVAPPIVLTEGQERTLRASALCLRGKSNGHALSCWPRPAKQHLEIAAEKRIGNQKAARWRKAIPKHLAWRVQGRMRLPLPGRTPTITSATVPEVVVKTTQEKPPDATHWSTRTMVEATGLSEKSVRRIWHKHGLKPHLLPNLQSQQRSVVYGKAGSDRRTLSQPPEHAIVLCADEKSRSRRWTEHRPSCR